MKIKTEVKPSSRYNRLPYKHYHYRASDIQSVRRQAEHDTNVRQGIVWDLRSLSGIQDTLYECGYSNGLGEEVY